MPPTLRPQILPGEADEQARQRCGHIQAPGQCSSVHEPTIYAADLYDDFLSPAYDIFPEMRNSVPTIKREPNFDDIAESLAQHRNRSGKRSGEEAFSSDQVDSDSVRAKRKAKTNADNGDKPTSQFACPFQKLDPLKHHDCLKYALNRIKDVKQHVYRRHKQPDYYCARCFDIFKTADARDEHARSKNCDNLEAPSFEGITEAQRNRLNKSSSRGIDPQEQWFEMWDIIFPNNARPSSAWVGSHMEEMVPLLRSLWSRKNSGIVAKAEKKQARQLDRTMLDGVMETIFDCLEAEASASRGKRARRSCSQNQHGSMGTQMPMSTPPSKVINGPSHLIFAEPHEFLRGISSEPEGDFQRGFVFGQE